MPFGRVSQCDAGEYIRQSSELYHFLYSGILPSRLRKEKIYIIHTYIYTFYWQSAEYPQTIIYIFITYSLLWVAFSYFSPISGQNFAYISPIDGLIFIHDILMFPVGEWVSHKIPSSSLKHIGHPTLLYTCISSLKYWELPYGSICTKIHSLWLTSSFSLFLLSGYTWQCTRNVVESIQN